MDENCLSELIDGCCCECGLRDDDKTCCKGLYIVKEHGYCQGFKRNQDEKIIANAHFSDKRMSYVAVLHIDKNGMLRRRFLKLNSKNDAETVAETDFSKAENEILEVQTGDKNVKWYLVRNGKLEAIKDMRKVVNYLKQRHNKETL